MSFSPSEAAKQTSEGRMVGSVCIAVDGQPRRRFPMNLSADLILIFYTIVSEVIDYQHVAVLKMA